MLFRSRVTGQQIAEGLSKALTEAKAQVQQEALFLLHTGKFYDGEQDEWEIEADSYNTVSAFCHAHPEQTIGLYAAPVNLQQELEAQNQACRWSNDMFKTLKADFDKLREAAQAALDVLRGEVEPVPGGLLAYDGAIESLVEALEAMK